MEGLEWEFYPGDEDNPEIDEDDSADSLAELGFRVQTAVAA